MRDAQANGIDLDSLRAEAEFASRMDEDVDDYSGFLSLWNADIDRLLYAV